MPYEEVSVSSHLSWPSLASRRVSVGGAVVAYSDAAEASAVLSASRTSAISPVLAAARSPLAGCDYRAAGAPYLAAARSVPKTGRAGAAGRHVAKAAFLAAVAEAMAAARRRAWEEAVAAFRADERYFAEVARAAGAISRRARAAAAREQVRREAARAAASCAADPAPCALETACGTGACRFAAPSLAFLSSPAGPGRLARPPGHARAGQGFSPAPAAAELAAARPWRPRVTVSDAETCTADETAA